MRPELSDFREVMICRGPDSDKYHEIRDGEPICGETADRNWEIVPVFEAKGLWYEPCQRENCCVWRNR